MTFEWANAGSTTPIGSQTINGVPSNTAPSVTVPANTFTEGGSYAWRVTTTDGVRATASPWCEFSVDTIKPGVPSVTSALYPSIATTNTWGHGGAGQAGSFTFTGTGTNPPVTGLTATTGATCTAGEGAAQAIDGSLSTKWCSADTNKFLKLTLPTPQMVTSVVLRHAGANNEPVAWNTKDYDIQLSSDDTTYWTALQVRGNTASVTTHDLDAPGTAKYVKINVLTPASDGNTAARLYEAEVYAGTRLSATATSPNTSCSVNETADKAVDGQIGTKWCSPDTGTKTLQLDLGSVQTVSNVGHCGRPCYRRTPAAAGACGHHRAGHQAPGRPRLRPHRARCTDRHGESSDLGGRPRMGRRGGRARRRSGDGPGRCNVAGAVRDRPR